MSFTIIALYKFVPIDDPEQMKASILPFCQSEGIQGTLLLGTEGINGTIAGSDKAIEHFITFITDKPEFTDLVYKRSYADEAPFHRMKVSIKTEIVTSGVRSIDPLKQVGTYVPPKEWDKLIEQEDVIVVDTRNDYEYKLGTFKQAENPETDTFREFPDYVKKRLAQHKDKKIAMFCTGGIRCEKATSYLLDEGFENVYHLQGGILKYLEEIPESESSWQGECFVFDNRVSVDHQLRPGNYEVCHACRTPISEEDKQSEFFKPSVSCPHCHATQSVRNRERAEERHKQMCLAKERGEKFFARRVD